MRLRGTHIDDACSEAFAVHATRLVVTAIDEAWLVHASDAYCGYGTSILGCDAEVGVEHRLGSGETPDGRSGAALMAFARGVDRIGRATANRAGQTLLTCPTAAVFDGLAEVSERAALGDYLRYFGDGHERQDADAWVVPIMEGETPFPKSMGVVPAVAGGVLIVCGEDLAATLGGAERAADAVADMPGVITPFPGGVCRSGSKAGSRYRGLRASTNEAYCPSLMDAVATKLPEGVQHAYEVVYDAIDEPTLREAMRLGLHAAAGDGVIAITSSDYGGKLGSIRLRIRDLC